MKSSVWRIHLRLAVCIETTLFREAEVVGLKGSQPPHPCSCCFVWRVHRKGKWLKVIIYGNRATHSLTEGVRHYSPSSRGTWFVQVRVTQLTAESIATGITFCSSPEHFGRADVSPDIFTSCGREVESFAYRLQNDIYPGIGVCFATHGGTCMACHQLLRTRLLIIQNTFWE